MSDDTFTFGSYNYILYNYGKYIIHFILLAILLKTKNIYKLSPTSFLVVVTVVVAFDIGGNGDMIEHKKNGFHAKPYSEFDLVKGIEWALEQDAKKGLSRNARIKVENYFSEQAVTRRYIKFYNNILVNG